MANFWLTHVANSRLCSETFKHFFVVFRFSSVLHSVDAKYLVFAFLAIIIKLKIRQRIYI